jgi:tetratricopeptide (TPR) repeat protein
MTLLKAACVGPKLAPRAELRGSLLALIEAGRVPEALRTLERLADEAQTYRANQELAEGVLAGLPEEFLGVGRAAELYAAVLGRARKVEELLLFYQRCSEAAPGVRAGVALYAAWALALSGQAHAALRLLEEIEGRVAEADRGIYLRFKAEALAFAGAVGWQEAFIEARRYLSAGALGRCLLEEGNHRYRRGQGAEARVLWAEALSHLGGDPYYSAWLHHSLGITVLAKDPLEAEPHLLTAEALSRGRAAQEFRARALCGLGAVRRSLREWERAVSSYRAALKAARDPDDRQEALWGIGFTLRLSGHPAEAIPYFLQAHAATASSALFIEIAAARLMLGSVDGAEAALGQAEVCDPRDRVKLTLIQAEIARLRGNRGTLTAALQALDSGSAWVQEERGCFPELLAILDGPGGLNRHDRHEPCPTTVEVCAAGILRVRVNGREVPLRPNSRAAELLVLLLEAGREETLERLAEALFPDGEPTTEGRGRARQAIWAQAQKLRLVLGWEASVLAEGGVYRLDPRAHWIYRSTDGGKPFLEGVYSPWVLEKREQLA